MIKAILQFGRVGGPEPISRRLVVPDYKVGAQTNMLLPIVPGSAYGQVTLPCDMLYIRSLIILLSPASLTIGALMRRPDHSANSAPFALDGVNLRGLSVQGSSL